MRSGKLTFNVKPLSDLNEDKAIGLAGKSMKKVSIFIDDALENSMLPSCFPNYSQAKLSGIDLSYTNLFTNFNSADLSNGNLREAGLTGAILNSAKLNGANLIETRLRFADLTGTNLTGANLDSTIWSEMICPDGTKNSGTSPCTSEQLNLA